MRCNSSGSVRRSAREYPRRKNRRSLGSTVSVGLSRASADALGSECASRSCGSAPGRPRRPDVGVTSPRAFTAPNVTLDDVAVRVPLAKQLPSCESILRSRTRASSRRGAAGAYTPDRIARDTSDGVTHTYAPGFHSPRDPVVTNLAKCAWRPARPNRLRISGFPVFPPSSGRLSESARAVRTREMSSR